MNPHSHRISKALGAALVLLAVSAPAYASWPSDQPIKIIVPQAARSLAAHASAGECGSIATSDASGRSHQAAVCQARFFCGGLVRSTTLVRFDTHRARAPVLRDPSTIPTCGVMARHSNKGQDAAFASRPDGAPSNAREAT